MNPREWIKHIQPAIDTLSDKNKEHVNRLVREIEHICAYKNGEILFGGLVSVYMTEIKQVMGDT
jgi:hypothetical protein